MLPTPEAQLLKSLRALLAVEDDDPVGGWMVQGRLPAAQLEVAVAGLGRLSAPLRLAELQALQAHREPAPFGLREQTLVDPRVRDAGEIDASALSLTWAPGAEARLCRQIAEGLGLASIELRPHKSQALRQGRPYTLRCLKDYDAATRDAGWRRSLEAARQRLRSSMRRTA